MDVRFHGAQAALARGDLDALASIIEADADLSRARSSCDHPTLLQCLVLTMPPVENLEELIDVLAKRGAELSDPLIAAAGIENVRAVKRLIDLGADIEGNGRWSPLEEALYWGNAASVSLLLDRGATIRNLRTAAGVGDDAAIARCFDETGALTSAAGSVESPFAKLPIPPELARDPQQILCNALVYAAAWGRTKAINTLVGRGARINFIPAGFDFAGTPLHYAALQGRRQTVDQLLKMGADPALPDTKIGKLPEDWAEHDGHRELASHLRQARLGMEQ